MSENPMPAVPLVGQHPEWCDCNECADNWQDDEYWEYALAAHIALYGENDPQINQSEEHGGYGSWEEQAAYEDLCYRCGADYGCCEHTEQRAHTALTIPVDAWEGSAL